MIIIDILHLTSAALTFMFQFHYLQAQYKLQPFEFREKGTYGFINGMRLM